MTEEIWASIPGYEGRYEVSSVGRVCSLPRTLNDGRQWQRCILRPGRRSGRYVYVVLHKDGVRRPFAVHQLVLMAFVGPCLQGMQGCHFNGNPVDNSIGNLRWDTPKSNCEDRSRHGHTASRPGERHHNAKLTTADVKLIVELVKGGAVQRAVAARFGVHPTTICEIVKGKKWAHLNQQLAY